MTGAAGDRFAARAVFRLSLIEFWERYSYYTTFALLALFAAAPVISGGLGWNNGESLRFFGAYLFVIQVTPVAGGLLADRWLGKRFALRIGAGALALGHSLLAIAATMPWLHADGAMLKDLVSAAHGKLCGWSAASLGTAALKLYRGTTVAFYAGVTLIAIGNGLFKPILTVIVGRLPHADEAARTRAFTTFFLYINVGGLLSILLGGWLAQRFGWAWAFGGSALGMLVAIATMLLLERNYLGSYLDRPDAISRDLDASVPATSSMVSAVGVLLLLLVMCSSFSYQSYGFVSLFTAQLVRRDIDGFTVPPTWFTALNPITIMLLTPVLLRVWRRGGLGSDWSTVQHIAVALLLMALGFVPLVAAALQAERLGLANPLWVMAAIVLIACSELLYSPAGMAASTRIAPVRLQTLAIGAQGAAIGLGAWLSGQVGALAFESGKVAVMAAASFLALASGALLWIARRWFARLRL